jgi:hypothetical protein
MPHVRGNTRTLSARAVLAGVQDQPLHLMARAGWKHRPWLVVWRSFQDALALARSLSPADFDSVAQLSEVR